MSILTMSANLPAKSGVTALSRAPSKQTTTDKGFLDKLSNFIPTEILAPYAAALSLAPQYSWNVTTVHWIFVAVCPFLLILFALAQSTGNNKTWPAWAPLTWRALAATAAFAVWALSVPSNPLQQTVGGAAMAGFLAITIAPILEALDSIVMKLLGFQNGQL